MTIQATPLGATKLFTPLKLGGVQLKHRVIMAPLTRVRSPEHIPGDGVAEYYRQRASDGGLIISEAAHISVMGGNYFGAPGIFTPEHKRAWKKVTDGVHQKGGFIYAQLWHIGRAALSVNIGGRTALGPSSNRIEGDGYFTGGLPVPHSVSKEMTQEDINDTISDYVHSAKLAIEAGFDGVEIHNANGYLLDQFLCDNINKRTDKYGGSIENRTRFTCEVVDAVIAAIGAENVGIRFSPFSFFQGTLPSDPIGQYGYAIRQMDTRGLAYIHLIEPRMDLVSNEATKVQRLKDLAASRGQTEEYSTKTLRAMIKNTPFLTNGSYNGANAEGVVENGEADAIVYGRYFISNPDLPERLEKGYPLAPYDRSLFYTPDQVVGYTDYPVYNASL